MEEKGKGKVKKMKRKQRGKKEERNNGMMVSAPNVDLEKRREQSGGYVCQRKELAQVFINEKTAEAWV